MSKKGILFVLIVITSNAFADSEKFKLGNKENVTAVSGYASNYKELAGTGPYLGVTGFSWGEKTDDPCGMIVSSEHINKKEAVEIKYGENSKDYIFGDLKNYAYGGITLYCNGNVKNVHPLSSGQYVRKIRVCTTDKNKTSKNKLKGLRVWYRTIEHDGYKDGDPVKMINQSAYQEATHKPNCDKWHPAVSCASDEIAAKVRVHYHNNATYPSVSGISLVCKKVNFKKKKASIHDEKTPSSHTNDPGSMQKF